MIFTMEYPQGQAPKDFMTMSLKDMQAWLTPRISPRVPKSFWKTKDQCARYIADYVLMGHKSPLS